MYTMSRPGRSPEPRRQCSSRSISIVPDYIERLDVVDDLVDVDDLDADLLLLSLTKMVLVAVPRAVVGAGVD